MKQGSYFSVGPEVEYDRLIGEWLAAGRPTSQPAQNDLAVVELIARYKQFAKSYYRKDGKPTGTLSYIGVALDVLRRSYGRTNAIDFGPLALKALRQKMIDANHARTYINKLVDCIRRMFKWAVAEELLPPSVYQALQSVPGLRKGRGEGRETPPVKPVDDATVDATLPRLPAVVADMVRFQRLTGCRPGEVCIVRPCDVDTTGEVWSYRPASHKTEHHGRERVIFVGPRGQDVLRPYLLRDKASYCFAPADSERKRRQLAHERRATPLSCGNRPGTSRKRKRRRAPGDRYDVHTYRRAIDRAVVLVNRGRTKDAEPGAKPELLQSWSPNQLRHSAATEIRRRFGLEAAQVALGHSKADVTQVYAERDWTKAAAVMREVG
jgi:integrase